MEQATKQAPIPRTFLAADFQVQPRVPTGRLTKALRLPSFNQGIMIMSENITRRALVQNSLIAGVLVPVAGLCVSSDASAAPAAVDPNDPAAKALHYVTQSTKPDQKCAGCDQFQGKAGDAQGPCTIFAGKTVVSTGWCMSWVMK